MPTALPPAALSASSRTSLESGCCRADGSVRAKVTEAGQFSRGRYGFLTADAVSKQVVPVPIGYFSRSGLEWELERADLETATAKDAVTQFAAASRAPDRADFAIIATGLQRCVAGMESGRRNGEDPVAMRARVEKRSSSLS